MLMDKLTEELDVWGCDTKGALDRLLGDTGFYHECLMLFAEDKCFINLDLCLDKGDIVGAYEACHTLKGVAGNLGITPLFLSLSALAEKLKSGLYFAPSKEYSAVLKNRDKFILTCKRCG